MTHEKERLQKYLSRAGVCSRREAERWVLDGRVCVNGVIVREMGTTVTPNDQVSIDGQAVSAPTVTSAPTKSLFDPARPDEGVRVFLYYKPLGLVTTHRDTMERPTVFQDIRRYAESLSLPDHVISVGRLDLNSEGLLIVTNSGAYARQMEHPSSHIPRTYRVRVFGVMSPQVLRDFKAANKGVTVEGVRYQSLIITPDTDALSSFKKAPRNYWLTITLHEGKNREIRKVLSHFGFQVNRLIRTQYGPFYLADLNPGELKEWT